jgi:hypothetical protein
MGAFLMFGDDRGRHEAELFLAGLAVAVAGLAAAVVAIGAGGIRGGISRRQRHAAAPPDRGSVPAERHRQTRSAAAR